MTGPDSVQAPTRSEVLAFVMEFTADAIDADASLQSSELSEATSLIGTDAVVDSLGLVQILADVEETLSDQYGHPIDLTDDSALSQERSPFRTIGTLVDHIMVYSGVPHEL